MPTSDLAAPTPANARKVVDVRFGRRLVVVNAAVPAALLGWDAWHHELGADAVKYVLHTTGLLGLIFLVLTLVVTPLRRFTDRPQLIALRRSLGLAGFFYLCAHFTVFFVFDRAASVSSTVHEILVRRYLQIGAAALVLLVPLALTSADRMVTWLGAKRWKALHRLAYVSTALGAVHYYLSVKADVRQPLVFAGAVALLLAFRPVFFFLDRQHARERKVLASFVPRRRAFWSGELEVLRVVQETPDVRTFRLGAVGAAGGGALPFQHQPGQYLNLALTVGGRRVNRSYTIASSPTLAGACEITVKREERGVASHHLHDTVKEGARLHVSAPAGRFVFTGDDGSTGVVLIGGGVGITPLMAMVRYLADRAWTGDVYLVLSAREEVDVVFARELAALQASSPRLRVIVTLTGDGSPGWTGARGRISLTLLRRSIPDLERLPVYLCGPGAMMVSVQSLLRGLGIPAERIHTEAFVSLPDQVDGGALVEGVFAVSFARSGTRTEIVGGQSLLEAAENAGIELPFECRSGICGQCKTRLVEGRVIMGVQDALDDEDRKKHLVLACQAHAVTDLVIDA